MKVISIKAFESREVDKQALKAINDLNTTDTKDVYNLDTAFLKTTGAFWFIPILLMIP